jgi:hypothetical protein
VPKYVYGGILDKIPTEKQYFNKFSGIRSAIPKITVKLCLHMNMEYSAQVVSVTFGMKFGLDVYGVIVSAIAFIW